MLFSGLQALERLSFGGCRIRDTLIAQSRILMFWYYTTYLLLEKNKPKYQQLEPLPKLLIETFDNDNLHPTEHQGDLQIKTFDNDNLDKTQPEGDLQMETLDNENLEKIQPEGTLGNENLEKNQAEGDLQINSFDKDNMEKPQPEEPPSLEKVEPKDDDTETPQIDQIRPFILEGL